MKNIVSCYLRYDLLSNLNSNFAICTKRGKNSVYKSLEMEIYWKNAFVSYLLVGTSFKRRIKFYSKIKFFIFFIFKRNLIFSKRFCHYSTKVPPLIIFLNYFPFKILLLNDSLVYILLVIVKHIKTNAKHIF